MTVNKRSKHSRMRGSYTHGWGAKKKHRGAGHRGGRGMAGTGKRADQKKPSIWKERYFGRLGFKTKGVAKEIMPVNISYFEDNADRLLSEKAIEKKGDIYEIDTTKLGFNKVLGCGMLTKKFRITSKSFSRKSIERIKEAGGEAVQLKKNPGA